MLDVYPRALLLKRSDSQNKGLDSTLTAFQTQGNVATRYKTSTQTVTTSLPNITALSVVTHTVTYRAAASFPDDCFATELTHPRTPAVSLITLTTSANKTSLLVTLMTAEQTAAVTNTELITETSR